MAVLTIRSNPNALTTEDKMILSDFINANFGIFMAYCEQQHCSQEQVFRLMNFVENHAAPFDDNMCDVDI
jgi:hypothetical protein